MHNTRQYTATTRIVNFVQGPYLQWQQLKRFESQHTRHDLTAPSSGPADSIGLPAHTYRRP
jgi:hypothetical protein